MHIKIPDFAEKALYLLNQSGYEAYIVGGCVRDTILGKLPYDWDITTNAKPLDIINVFSNFRVIETGLKHGTVTVIIDKNLIEITTYRIDGKYSDNRRPDTVKFTSSLFEDLSRRDFTINAMAYNSKDGLVDYFDAIKDLENKYIRCVGEADKRFNEDALRILRALRFASLFSFDIEEQTSESILKNRLLLNNIAQERISAEFNKLIIGDGVKNILNKYWEVFSVFIPEIKPSIGFKQNNPHHIYDVWTHTIKSIENIEKDKILRLTMFFHDLGKPLCYTQDSYGIGHFKGHGAYSVRIAENVLKRLKYDNLTIDCVSTLVKHHDIKMIPDRKILKRILNKLNPQYFEQLLLVHKADFSAQNPKYLDEKLNTLKKAEEQYNKIISENQCFSIKSLAVSGKDIINIGVKQGTAVGEILNKLIEMVIDEKISNEKLQLLNEAKKMINS